MWRVHVRGRGRRRARRRKLKRGVIERMKRASASTVLTSASMPYGCIGRRTGVSLSALRQDRRGRGHWLLQISRVAWVLRELSRRRNARCMSKRTPQRGGRYVARVKVRVADSSVRAGANKRAISRCKRTKISLSFNADRIRRHSHTERAIRCTRGPERARVYRGCCRSYNNATCTRVGP